MAELRDWQDMGGRRDTLQTAAETLAAGKLVAFPLETGYAIAACTLLPAAVERLADWPRTSSRPVMSLLLPGPAALADWAPAVGRLGRRLGRRCWPGPVQFIVEAVGKASLASRLDARVRTLLFPDDALRARVPVHEAIRQTSMLLPGFLAFVEMEIGDGEEPLSGAALQTRHGDRLGLVIDDVTAVGAKPASVVRLLDDGWQLLREGAISAAMLEELSACMIVFVCTGNTCRSPLAEALCKKRLAERMGCGTDELPQRGFAVFSAGLSAAVGCPAAEGAVATATAYGVDLQAHVTRPATATLLKQADYVFAMTESHLRAITSQVPGTANWVRMLSPDGDDIPDPIGGDESVYQQCAERIWQCLEARLAEIS